MAEMEDRVRMIDVGDKPDTERVAVAKGWIKMQPETFAMLRDGRLPKGDVLATAQVAGIMAAKKTPDILPLCHPLLLSEVKVDFTMDEKGSRVEISARVRNTGKTGVEMEALTAVSASALTIYDMCKGVDKTMEIGGIRLSRKSGGKSGEVVYE